MNIIEKKLIGKKSPETCEDGIVITNDFVAVIDGSTSKATKQVCTDISNGRYAMLLTAECIEKMDAKCSLNDFCQTVTKVFQEACTTHGFPLPSTLLPHERMAASAAIYSRENHELWMVGDCQALVDGKLYENNKPAEATNAKKRSRFIRQALAAGAKMEDFQTEDAGRKVILSDIIASMEKQNTDYAVIDGTPIAIEKIRTIMLTTNEPHEIVLATDGYPFLRSTCEESERLLQHLLHDDPLCIELFQATKGLMAGNRSFDDRAYVRFATGVEKLKDCKL